MVKIGKLIDDDTNRAIDLNFAENINKRLNRQGQNKKKWS